MLLNVKPSFPILSDLKTKDLISGVVYKFQCNFYNDSYYYQRTRYLNIRAGEHIGVSPFAGAKVKPINNGAVRDHLLHCNYWLSSDNVKILVHVLLIVAVQKAAENLLRNISAAVLQFLDLFLNEFQLWYS